MLAHQVGHGARIKRSRPGAHEQTIQGSKAHCRIDAASVAHRTKTCPISKRSDDDSTARKLGGDGSQSLRDEFVGEAVDPYLRTPSSS